MAGDSDATIDSLIARAESAWPAIRLDPGVFAAHLRERLATAGSDLRVEDLYLACACARGIPEALAAFEQHHMPAVKAAVARVSGGDAADEIAASLREQLFYGRDGAAPTIASYTGQGSLRGWLRVSATRLALKKIRRDRHIGGDDQVIARVAAPATAPDLLYVKSHYGAAFSAAFQEGMQQLERKDRTLLRQRYLDDLSGDDIAALHGVHRATVVRWLAAAREALLGNVRDALARRLQANPSELDTIMRAVQSQLDMSLGPLLESGSG